MELAISLSLAASLCTATSSICQLALGVRTLSHRTLITHATQPRRPEAGEATNRELTRRSR